MAKNTKSTAGKQRVHTPPQLSYPAVSVVIPLYNAAKYIGECLDSLLAQTFQNFEVVVVDDCSTDDSVAVVESYRERFGGRLKLIKTKVNHGNPGLPRNLGLNFSRGEYVYFMDDDDAITATALAEMYALATNFKVDVVYMYRCFTKVEDSRGQSELKTTTFPKRFALNEPLIISDSVSERIKLFLNGILRVMPWLKFLKRDFLVTSGIIFPEISVSEDDFWTIELLCCAKNIVIVPNTVYINRDNPESLTRKKKSAAELIKYHMTPLIDGEKYFWAIVNKYDVFKKNPHYAYAWVEYVAKYCFERIFLACAGLKPQEVYELFIRNFLSRDSTRGLLDVYLCTLANNQQKQLFWAQKRIGELEAEIKRLKGEE